MRPYAVTLFASLLLLTPGVGYAQEVPGPELQACQATGLMALKERSPAIKNLILDVDTFIVAKANVKVEETPVHFVIMGEAYIERKETGKSQQFLCLIGEKGKVLLTFFTPR